MIARLARGRFHYAWIVTAVTFVVLLTTAGIRTTPGVIILPLEQEFGWTRLTVSTAVGINLLVYGLIGPFAASLVDRFGIRKVIVTSLLIVAGAQGLIVLMHAAWQLDFLWGVVVACGTGSTAIVLGATVANRWFVKSKGLVMGLLSSANAAGQILFLPVIAWIAVNNGWRYVTLLMGAIALLILPAVVAFMRSRPAELGLVRYGAPADDDGGLAVKPLGPISGLMMASKTGDFWLLAGSYFVCGASTLGLIGTHFIPASAEHGIPETTAANILASMAVFNIAGTTVSGLLTDRFDPRKLLCVYYLTRGISLLFLPYAFGLGTFGLLGFMVFYGLDWIATIPPTVNLTSRIYGQRNAPVVFGWVSATHQLGSAFAAFGAGALRTWMGDYQIAFMSSGLLCLIAAGVVIRIASDRPSNALPTRPIPVGAAAAG